MVFITERKLRSSDSCRADNGGTAGEGSVDFRQADAWSMAPRTRALARRNTASNWRISQRSSGKKNNSAETSSKLNCVAG